VPCTRCRNLSARWSCGCSSVTAVKANVTAGRGMRADRAAVRERVMDDGWIYVRNSGVVVERCAGPIPADEADTEVAVTVVDAAIEPDTRAPVTCGPKVSCWRVTPVTRRPIKADGRRSNPNTRNPVVAVVTVTPIAGGPLIVWCWSGRLFIRGKRRRGIVYRRALIVTRRALVITRARRTLAVARRTLAVARRALAVVRARVRAWVVLRRRRQRPRCECYEQEYRGNQYCGNRSVGLHARSFASRTHM
jgi:hypothetical protein